MQLSTLWTLSDCNFVCRRRKVQKGTAIYDTCGAEVVINVDEADLG